MTTKSMTRPGWNGIEVNGYSQFLDANWETSAQTLHPNGSGPLAFSRGVGTTLSGMSPSLGSTASKDTLMPSGVGAGWSQTQLNGQNYIPDNSSMAIKSYLNPTPFFGAGVVEFHSHSQPSGSRYDWNKTSTPVEFHSHPHPHPQPSGSQYNWNTTSTALEFHSHPQPSGSQYNWSATSTPLEFHSHSQPLSGSRYDWSKTSTATNFLSLGASADAEDVSSSDRSQPRPSTTKANEIPGKTTVSQSAGMSNFRVVSHDNFRPFVGGQTPTDNVPITISDSPVKKPSAKPYPRPIQTTSASPAITDTTQRPAQHSIASRTVSPPHVFSSATRQTMPSDGMRSLKPLELALPLRHVTGAQNLLSWPAIRRLLPAHFSNLFIRGGPASQGIRNHEFMPRDDVGYFLKRDLGAIDLAERVFMDRIFILHPLLDSRQLHESVTRFKSTLVNALKKPSSKDQSPTMKRKRDAREEFESPEPEMKARIRRDRGFPAMNISRTLENAIVLLVIGLGLICGRPSPNFEVEKIVNPRRQTEGSLPGFSQYHLAVGIIGDFFGAVTLEYIQANILACLYRGQLTDVHGSHHHILNAAWSCWTLLHSWVANHFVKHDFADQPCRRPSYTDPEANPKSKNLTIIAFWSIIQLESDILAEVELLPSGISRLEQSMESFPNAESLGMEAPMKDEIIRSYSDQIQLRRTLNAVHTGLYERKESSSSKLEKPNFMLMGILNDSLEAWRDRLKSRWQWDVASENHKSSDINEARTRGKYFGAKYIIHRPALEYLLRSARSKGGPDPAISQSDKSKRSNGEASAVSPQHSPISTDKRLWDAAKVCIEAAKRSTTVFDDIPSPLILTNIYGTAQAQFGNVLVLMATFDSETSLADLIDRRTMSALLNRTIKFLGDHRGCSPGMDKDIELLRKIKKRHFLYDDAGFRFDK